jgi:hypothetical protein
LALLRQDRLNSGDSMDAELIVVGGKASKRSIKLKLPMVIGRGRNARLTIAHPMVSRRHTELFERDGLLMVRDLGSLNGTVVAGQRIQEAPLPPEAEFTVGPLTFRAIYKYPGDLAALPAVILDTKPAASPAAPSGDTEFPDFEAIIDEEVVVAEPTPSHSEKPNKSRADKTVTMQTTAAGAKKPAAKAPADKKPAAAGKSLEERLDRTEAGAAPAKKPAGDAFDDLLSDLD